MKSGFDNWSDVRVFLAVLRRGSTLAASKELGMAQPTVARRIEALEHALGLTLFERDTRGFRPTAEAGRLAPLAEAVEKAALEVEAEAKRARRAGARPIRITAPSVNFSENFASILSDFTAENPGVQFELIASYELLDLCAGEADVAIRIVPAIEDDRLICTRLTEGLRTLFASRGYAEKHGLPKGPEEFAGHRFVAWNYKPGRSSINDWLLERIKPEQIVSRADPDTIMAALRAGLGIGPLNLSLAADAPDLVRCFDPPAGTALPSWLVFSPEAYRRPEVRAFAAFFAPRYRAVLRSYR